MKTRALSLLIAGLLLWQPLISSAAALGELSVRSSIGQKLDAEIEIIALTAKEAEELSARLASPEAYADAGVEFSPVLRSLQFTIDKQGERHIVRVTSDVIVNDPFITILFELNASGNRTIRQYAILMDPPVVDTEAVAVTEPQTVTQAELDEPVADAKAAAEAEAGSTRIVERGDTLARIATQIRPADARLEQVLVALQRLNPDALDGGNINRIKSGSVLTLPDRDTIKAIDARDARQLVNAQTADFNRYRRQLAGKAVMPTRTQQAADADNTRSSSGKIGVQIKEEGKDQSAQDKLRLSAAGGSGNAGSAASDAGSLDKIASDKALDEANARIAELEKNVRDMQQLLELKNKTLADMQNQAAAPAVPLSAAQPAAVAPKQEPDQNITEQLAAYLATVTALAQELPVMIAGGLVMALLVAFIFLRMRRRARKHLHAVKSNLKKSASGSQSIFGVAGGRNIDTTNSVFHSNFVPSVSQLDTNEVDAVAEADVYVAYGRDEQAEEILIEALRNHPERHALRIKLLEIYSRQQNKSKFNELAMQLQRLTNGLGEEWAQALKLGQLLDPLNALYQSVEAPSAAQLLNRGHRNKTEEKPDQRVEPSLTLVVTDTPVQKQSAIMDFDSKLEEMLAANKRDSVVANPSRISALQVQNPEFAMSVINDILPTKKPSSEEHALTALRTKLDLALACQEIGDSVGARELLSEVANAEHPELAKRAQSLLAQLA